MWVGDKEYLRMIGENYIVFTPQPYERLGFFKEVFVEFHDGVGACYLQAYTVFKHEACQPSSHQAALKTDLR